MYVLDETTIRKPLKSMQEPQEQQNRGTPEVKTLSLALFRQHSQLTKLTALLSIRRNVQGIIFIITKQVMKSGLEAETL